jgi:hypothetical protein
MNIKQRSQLLYNPYPIHLPYAFGNFGTQKAQFPLGFSWFAETLNFGAENWPPNHGGEDFSGWMIRPKQMFFSPKIFPSAEVCSGRSNGIQQVIF